MHISIACSNCGSNLKVAESATSRKIKCPKCDAALLVHAKLPGQSRPSPAAPHSDVELPEQEPPNRSHESRASPGPPPLPPTENEKSPGVIQFEGVMTPRIALLDREQVLVKFEASFWDLGLIGWLFRYKNRLLVTSHRVMLFRKRLIANELSIIWLAQITFTRVGQSLNWKKLVIGGFLCLSYFPSLFLRPFLPLDVTGRISGLDLVIQVTVVLIGAYLVFISREKVMVVSTGEDKVRIELMRMKPGESRRFVDSVFRALDARHFGYGKATEPSSTNGATV